MGRNQQLVHDAPVRRFDYPNDTVLLAADLGADVDASAEVVDGTALVVTDDDHYEVPVPAGEARAFIKNGVLTVEVSNAEEDSQ
jgi:hypothetical protein